MSRIDLHKSYLVTTKTKPNQNTWIQRKETKTKTEKKVISWLLYLYHVGFYGHTIFAGKRSATSDLPQKCRYDIKLYDLLQGDSLNTFIQDLQLQRGPHVKAQPIALQKVRGVDTSAKLLLMIWTPT